MLKVRVQALLATLALLLTLVPAVASAQSVPCVVVGTATVNGLAAPVGTVVSAGIGGTVRSEERRVGKECRCRGSPYP